MERKNTFGWLFIALVLIASVAVLACVLPLAQGAGLSNPYENWIETKDLKNCTISFTIDATYSDSVYGEERAYQPCDYHSMRFENGEFDSANNTFRVSNITKTDGEFGTTAKRTLKKECQITFDSGANNIISFSALVTNNIIDSMGDFSESESIKGSGSSFPLLEEIRASENTCYLLWGHEQMREYVKDIVKRTNTRYKVGDKYETSTRELTRFEFDEISWLDITFNGYLPRLRDSEGNCSWFGGKNDTGIDVTSRKQFCEERFEGTYDSKIFERKQVSDEFDAWMNERPKSTWERTALNCGYARELDTENDYFCAMRWQDNVTERYGDEGKPGHQHWWREQKIKVTNTVNNISVIVAPVDWGPHERTNRTIDLSFRAMEEINATTDVTWVEMCIVDSDTPLGLVTNQ